MDVYRPERMAGVREAVRGNGSVVGRGLGRSYGDAALNREGAVILSERLDRYLDFDSASGVLTCEAGVTLDDVLRHFVAKGFFPPVVPGTKYITLGGAVACDVHGKNHHQAGSLGRHLLDFVLVTADGERLRCSREEHPELFWATLGGMGLTGFIAELRIRLQRITSAYVSVDYDRTTDLDHALALFHESDARYAHSVAWIDCLARGAALGRSVLMRGNPIAVGDLGRRAARQPLAYARPSRIGIPVDLPSSLLNSVTVRALNAAYYHKHPVRARDVRMHYEPFFFPLDRIHNWNRLYGRRGFLQYQCVLPLDHGRDGLVQVLEQLAATRLGSFLAVLKRFGAAEAPAMLSFPLAGYTLSLDLPYRPEVLPLLDRLDRVVAAFGGRVYLAKDARLGQEMFGEMYPELPRWLSVKKRIDPTNHFASDLSRRLRLES
jgi:decaprenylphospho-beta-D-ribofuranose 2-oxidase